MLPTSLFLLCIQKWFPHTCLGIFAVSFSFISYVLSPNPFSFTWPLEISSLILDAGSWLASLLKQEVGLRSILLAEAGAKAFLSGIFLPVSWPRCLAWGCAAADLPPVPLWLAAVSGTWPLMTVRSLLSPIPPQHTSVTSLTASLMTLTTQNTFRLDIRRNVLTLRTAVLWNRGPERLRDLWSRYFSRFSFSYLVWPQCWPSLKPKIGQETCWVPF